MKRKHAITNPLTASLVLFLLGALALPPAYLATSQAAEATPAAGDSFRRKQQAQEKARALAGELVAGVLDIQIRQLEENGLKSLSIYKDIAAMKGHVHELMKGEMEQVVHLLVLAQEGPQKDRIDNFNKARGKIREIVVQLMAERQKLYRRMQIAKLAAEVRQLIALETKTRNITAALNEQKPTERERQALLTIEDQADVNKLYYQLVASLTDVSTWGGQIGAGASDGIRILKPPRSSKS